MGSMKYFKVLSLGSVLALQACASAPKSGPFTQNHPTDRLSSQQSATARLPNGYISELPDQVQFHQQDPRWANHTLGGSGESLKTDGCLVTSAAMALYNLGFTTNPADLTARLKAQKGFNARGWLVWSGLERVTGGIAKTRFYNEANDDYVRSCLSDGYYPLVKFKLKSRRSHWVMVVGDTKHGFYIRDPMVTSQTPIALSNRALGIDAVRCIGVDRI